MNIISIILTAVFVENIVLSQFLGLCPFIGTSNKKKQALGMGISVLVVLLITSVITFLIYRFILLPLNLTYLNTIISIFVIAIFVQVLEMLLKSKFPSLHKSLGIYLPLITTNCLILGASLNNVSFYSNGISFGNIMLKTLGVGLGYLMIIYVFASIRQEIEKNPIPKPFKNVAISLIVIALMALSFKGFLGLF